MFRRVSGRVPASRPTPVRRYSPLAAVVCVAASFALAVPAPAAADVARDREWALDALHADTAWQTSRGAGVTVAVLDTGVDATHPDLAGQVLPGKDLVGFGARSGDAYWAKHGTAMAGIIAGHGHGYGDADGVRGIAPAAKILPVRVILEDDDPQRKKARTTRGGALAEGIRWATDHGADVINLSLGDDSKSAHPEAAEDAAVRYALSKGVIVVASAGNGGESGDRASYPAAYPGVIAVTAVDRFGNRAGFSTRRWYASVAAPGVDIIIPDPDRRYYEGWGTSAAAAFVSGTAALISSAYPKLSPAQVKRLLEDTADDPPAGGRNDALGAGLVDPVGALRAAKDIKPQPSQPSASPYRSRYFGSGPDPNWPGRPGDGDLAGELAPACAGAGAVLLAAGCVLRLRRRPGRSGRS